MLFDSIDSEQAPDCIAYGKCLPKVTVLGTVGENLKDFLCCRAQL
ncbi:unnamed protein product [Gongylonema pulchrum]|uniref:Uncharacterized protein n=1 Tax=Gongylonema pulchrum TaxID=637853 RepID=A0A3P6UIA2_9BILA|nr:unnamed protein product [Gongylonema pulchrum]